MVEIQKADPYARRRLRLFALGYLLFMFGFLAGLLSFADALQAWLHDHGDYLLGHPGVVAVALFILGLPVLAGCFYLWRFAGRIIREQRFPTEGMKAVRDTVVLTGRAAVFRGQLIRWIAGLMAITCLLVPLLFWFLIGNYGGTTG